MNRFPLAAAIAALIVFVASVAGVAAFWGGTRLLAPAALTAEVRLDPVLLPSGIELDSAQVAEEMAKQLVDRAGRDSAIRITLGPEALGQLLEVVLPRLVGPTVVNRMVEAIPSLRSVLSLTRFRTAARISVVNHGSEPLADIALTLPGVLLAETSDGTALDIHVPEQGPRAVRIGVLEAGARLSLAAWLTEPRDGLATAIRLGAAGGTKGDVSVYGAEGWLGEELGPRPWARWLVGSLLVGAALTAFAVLVLIVFGALRPAANRA